MQERLLAPTVAAEGTSGEDLRDSWEDLEVPVLRSSLEEHRIVDVEPATPRAEEPPAGKSKAKESAVPPCAEPSLREEETARGCAAILVVPAYTSLKRYA
jgi:hypothetical protein